MATAVARKETTVVGVELSLTLDEARSLLEYLGLFEQAACTFRLSHPRLYVIEDALEDVLPA